MKPLPPNSAILMNAIAMLSPGCYVAAISGGVDSMVLLDLLSKNPQVSICVAHMDHGIRGDSHHDYELVRSAAATYGMPFYGARIALGVGASESIAREMRYGFLRSVVRRVKGGGILTAHHEDDLVETLALQLLRGTGRKGLTPLAANQIFRPLLRVRKGDLMQYAMQSGIVWREDSTNSDVSYARNRLRLGPLSNRSDAHSIKRGEMVSIYSTMTERNNAIDQAMHSLDKWILDSEAIVRWKFAQLPHVVARDYVAHYLRARGVEFDTRFLEQVTIALKVQKPNSRISAGVGRFIEIRLKTAKLLVQ